MWLWWQRLGQTLYPWWIAARQGRALRNCCYQHQVRVTSLISSLFQTCVSYDIEVSEIWYMVSLFLFHCTGLPSFSWNSFCGYNFIKCYRSLHKLSLLAWMCVLVQLHMGFPGEQQIFMCFFPHDWQSIRLPLNGFQNKTLAKRTHINDLTLKMSKSFIFTWISRELSCSGKNVQGKLISPKLSVLGS